jgi:hypothetical protein
MEKISRDQAIESGLKRYFTGLQCSKGHTDYRLVTNHTCISCLSENSKKYRQTNDGVKALKKVTDKRYYESHKESVLDRNKKNRHLYADARNRKAKEKRKADPEADRNYRRLYREANLEKSRAWSRVYASKDQKRNPQKWLASNAERRARIRQSTPTLLTRAERAEIVGIYHFAKVMSRITGQEWHVDHVVPLNGEVVSGLHVPSNLRAVPATENLQKSNKLVDELLSA